MSIYAFMNGHLSNSAPVVCYLMKAGLGTMEAPVHFIVESLFAQGGHHPSNASGFGGGLF
jgi:hypothetical protein